MKKLLKISLWIIIGLVVLILSAVTYYFFKIRWDSINDTAEKQASVEQYAQEQFTGKVDSSLFFQSYTFDPKAFKNPPRQFGPLTRWWWPGNDVEAKELERELKLFASVGIAGVEIQPFTMGLNPDAPKERLERVRSWDTPTFYENLAVVMETAQKEGLIVDLNSGGGWPTGGPHIALQDNFQNLSFSETTVNGNKKITWEIEKPSPTLANYLVSFMRITGFFPVQGSRLRSNYFKLEAVVASLLEKDERSFWINEVTDQVKLKSVGGIDITDKVKEGQLEWDAPEGEWHLVAFWSSPNDEHPILLPKENTGYVVDHFNAKKVIGNYNYLFGERTQLAQYYGNPFRAIFNDSYEFKADRHFTADFFEQFEKRRGYDIRPWLPANMSPGYNHMIAHIAYSHAKPAFVFSEESDWRLRYDYDLTLSDIFLDNMMKASYDWMGKRGLQHRTQAYGLKMDVMEASGFAHIPEAEQLFTEGSEGFLKVVAAGAHLYNRPLVTAESVVYRDRAYMSTPEKIKLSVDKAFTAGINQIIYHGSTYQYKNEDFGEYGWFPWSSPYSKADFSSDLDEDNPFWKFIPQLNDYIRRVQYALQSGKAKSEVLIYYPFLGFAYGEAFSNPQEFLKDGRLEKIEPPMGEFPKVPFVSPDEKPAPDIQPQWYQQVWETINELEAQGITWEFVNDASLQEAIAQNGEWNIRGNSYQALILPHTPYIQLKSAQNVQKLAEKGLKVVFVGEVPNQQPSFFDYEENDKKVEMALKSILKEESVKKVASLKDLKAWFQTLDKTFQVVENAPFLKQIQREGTDSSRLHFLRNNTADWNTLKLKLQEKYAYHYWLNPENGEISQIDSTTIAYLFAPYASIILYSTMTKINDVPIYKQSFTQFPTEVVQTLKKWDIQSDKEAVQNSELFDWREKENWQYLASEGIYKCTFDWAAEASDNYYLDLGDVYFTATIKLNGNNLGTLLYSPYLIKLSNLKSGKNELEVKIQPALRNFFVGKGLAGDEHYKQFKEEEHTLLPVGLLGPVRILKTN